MFKKRCPACDRKIDRKFDFCPYCSAPLKNIKKDYGLLGKSDADLNSLLAKPNPKNASFMDKIMTSAITGALKVFEKEFRQLEEQERKARENQPSINPNLQLFINGRRIPISNQEAQTINEEEIDEDGIKTKIIKKAPKISEETIKKSINLPRKEAKTKLTRLKDRVLYELDTPGIDSLNNVIVNQLENSIEVKAYTERIVYIKTLNVKLPLVSYSIRPDKLLLEFKGN